jgi:hypothetical protein
MLTWSMLPDGSDRRLEPLNCPTPQYLGGLLDVSPDGTRLLRDCSTPPPGASIQSMANGYGLVIQNVDGGASVTIKLHAMFESVWARWSPDGRQIEMLSSSGLEIYDVADGSTHAVPLAHSLVSPFGTWSPDGARLLTNDFNIIDVATGSITDRSNLFPPIPSGRSLPNGAFYGASFWAPDGTTYVWEESAVGTTNYYDLYRVDVATGSSALVLEQTFPIDIVFLSDGRLLTRSSMDQVVTIAPDGSDRQTFNMPWAYNDFVAAH